MEGPTHPRGPCKALFEKVRTELVPRLETGDGWADAERDEDDDPVENALWGYELAFQAEGDFETAHAFAEAREWYSELPIRAAEEYSDWEKWAPLTGTRLAPPPNTSRSVFDDIDAE